MDINLIRSAVTLLGFILFVAILIWAYRPSLKAQFDEAARVPLHADKELRP